MLCYFVISSSTNGFLPVAIPRAPYVEAIFEERKAVEVKVNKNRGPRSISHPFRTVLQLALKMQQKQMKSHKKGKVTCRLFFN